jgi:hypothetical protein
MPNREAVMTPAIGPVPAEKHNNGRSTKDNPNPTPAPNAGTTNMVPRILPITTASLAYTSTYQASAPKYRYMPSLSPSNSSNSPPKPEHNGYHTRDQDQNQSQAPVREPATEAARTALVGTHYNGATTRVVRIVSRKRNAKGKMTGTTASTAVVWGPDGGGDRKGSATALLDGSADTDGPSGNTKTDKVAWMRRIPLKDPHPGATAIRKGKAAGFSAMVVRVMSAYWKLVAPVFEAGSPISRRFAVGRSTWHDCVVYLLALVFVLVAFLVAVWGVKGMLLVAGLGRAVVRGGMVLVGF